MDPPRGTHLRTKGGPAEEERTSGLTVDPPRGIHLRTKGGPFQGECTWELGWALQGGYTWGPRVDPSRGSATGD